MTDKNSGQQPVSDADEKEVMMQAFDKVRQMFESRSWIMEGRGSYRYDDDRYKEEVRYLYDGISDTQLKIERLEVNCFDEDSRMSIRVGQSGYQSLTVDEAKALANFIISHIKNETTH